MVFKKIPLEHSEFGHYRDPIRGGEIAAQDVPLKDKTVIYINIGLVKDGMSTAIPFLLTIKADQ